MRYRYVIISEEGEFRSKWFEGQSCLFTLRIKWIWILLILIYRSRVMAKLFQRNGKEEKRYR